MCEMKKKKPQKEKCFCKNKPSDMKKEKKEQSVTNLKSAE